MSDTVTVGKQGRIVIPAGLRNEVGLAEGDVVSVAREGTRIIIERPADAARQLRGVLTELTQGRSLVDELLAERRVEATDDQR
ncbi:AbrB/MazE/SpoVT family DNA-binding domain-containing protein [Williamsia sp. M5A3_1d]